MPNLQSSEPYQPLATQDSMTSSSSANSDMQPPVPFQPHGGMPVASLSSSANSNIQPAAPYQPYGGMGLPSSSTASAFSSLPPNLRPPMPYQPFAAPSMTSPTPTQDSVTSGAMQPPVSYDPFGHAYATAIASPTRDGQRGTSSDIQMPAPYRPIGRRAAGSSRHRLGDNASSSILPYPTEFATATRSKLSDGTRTVPTSVKTPMSLPLFSFPDWPPLLVFLMMAFMFLLSLLAIVLYFATFPPHNGWVRRFFRHNGRQKMGDDYVRLNEDDSDEGSESEDLVMRGNGDMRHLDYLRQKAEKRRTEKQKWVSEVVAAEEKQVGLGIASASGTGCHPGQLLRQRRRRSLDLRFLMPEKLMESIEQIKDAAVSAPLPPARSFDSSPSSSSLSRNNSEEDLETGMHTSLLLSSYGQEPKGGQKEGYGFAAWFETVNAGIEYAAAKLARASHDHVVAPEEGLLLPVRDGEREVMADS
ncbi:hypothetical protein B0A48_00472 [Cryoendolithus antarcticus]|uniref:Uncharacterized protein n=1 Tax=Cryoendolithus antarcticus TaxID=1507870 RepID=A0A1V8TUL9_9PEZI|nr:hypothetical protein B0A48_00472 [Cryoendolithus antarcticus]